MARALADGGPTPRSVASRRSTKRPSTFRSRVSSVRRPTPKPVTNKPARQVVATNKPARPVSNITKAAQAAQNAAGAQKAAMAAKVAAGARAAAQRAKAVKAAQAIAGAAKAAAAAKKIAAPRPTTPTRPTRPTGGGGPKPPVKPPTTVPPVKPPVKPPTTVPPVPRPTTTQGSGTAAQATTLSGRGTFGRFNRKRQNRGPRTGLSMTPEMLAAAARQRIVNYS